MSHDQAVAEHLESLQALIADDVIDADVAAKTRPETPLQLRSGGHQPTCHSGLSLITHDADLCFVRVKHICQYLQHTLSYTLRYVPIPPTSKQKLWVLGDASFAPTGEKSQQGIVVYHGTTSNSRMGGNLVQWRSSRQDLVAKSACEAELIAASEALQQGENISIVIAEDDQCML